MGFSLICLNASACVLFCGPSSKFLSDSLLWDLGCGFLLTWDCPAAASYYLGWLVCAESGGQIVRVSFLHCAAPGRAPGAIGCWACTALTVIFLAVWQAAGHTYGEPARLPVRGRLANFGSFLCFCSTTLGRRPPAPFNGGV
jgi:hypothetical protein